MAKVETQTPISNAICCLRGVAPIRKPVLRSCEVSPALADAMHTTPPIVIASAAKDGAVQPFTRKIADVAIKVAMVMPEIGLAELPINPTMREETVTKRKPKTTMSSDAARLASQLTCAPGTGLKVRKKNMIAIRRIDPAITTLIGRSLHPCAACSAGSFRLGAGFGRPRAARPKLSAASSKA